MKKTVILLSIASLAFLAAAASGQTLAKPAREIGQNIHFMGKSGEIERGVRCGTPDRSEPGKRVWQAEVEDWLATNVAPDKATDISVVFHVIYRTRRGQEEGNVPQQWISDQIDVLNAAFQGTGFSFTLSQTLRHESKKYYTGCYNQDTRMKRAYAVELGVDPNTDFEPFLENLTRKRWVLTPEDGGFQLLSS